MIQVVDKNDLMELIGYSETQASKLIRKAKSQLVQEGFEWYKNRRVPIIPLESIPGIQIQLKNDIIEGNLQSAVMTEGEK